MIANTSGVCGICHKTYHAGTEITWTRYGGNSGVRYHLSCYNKPKQITNKYRAKCAVCGKLLFPGAEVIFSPEKKPNSITCLGCWSDRDTEPTLPEPTPPRQGDNDSNNNESESSGSDSDGESESESKSENESNNESDSDSDSNSESDSDEDESESESESKESPSMPPIPEDKPQPKPKVIEHENTDRLRLYVMAKLNVYLHGEAGSGKSYVARVVAWEQGLQFGYIGLTPQSPLSLLIGYMDGMGRYVTTSFRHIYENGGVFCIDELDNAASTLLVALNGAIENGECAFPDSVLPIKRSPNCIIIGTGNTPMLGPTPSYPERRPVDVSVRSRFVFIEWNTCLQTETKIVDAIYKHTLTRAWVAYVQRVRKWTVTNMPRHIVTQRASINGAKIIKALVDASLPVDFAMIAESVLFQGIDKVSSEKIVAANPLPRN